MAGQVNGERDPSEVVIMLMPKRVKWRKQMRGRMKGKALRGAEVALVNLVCRRWNRVG